MKIGIGFRGIRRRGGWVFFFAAGLVICAFIADTLTTGIATTAMRQYDVNPMVRPLSLGAYLAFSFARAVAAVAMLWWFWPLKLEPRYRNRLALVAIPFAYRKPTSYFGAALIMIAVPIKLAAVASNALALSAACPTPNALVVLALGILTGVLFSNAMLYWHWRRSQENQDGSA